jgi:hypothetical protein
LNVSCGRCAQGVGGEAGGKEDFGEYKT